MQTNKQPLDYSFGNWIRRRRKALDLTQQELAQRVGCSVSAIFKIEADERRPSRQIAELLADHLEIPPDQRALFLKVARKEKGVEALEDPQVSDPASHAAAPRLPTLPGPLIGREMELAQIIRLLQDANCRLLTITGQGGVGKTHLALHAAACLAEPSNQDIVFVSLAAVSGRQQCVSSIADAMGIVLYNAGDRAEQLITYLQDKQQILFLDNFEHLASDSGCVDLIHTILRTAPEVKMMTTSRQPLQVQAEWVFEVQGLPVPKSDKPEDLETSSAIKLFLQKANQAMVGFKASDEDLLDIARICELVEGLPLGIELAAAWVRTLSCREIGAEIQNSINFLEVDVRGLPERHRSIRATIEYSWQLLSAEEQRVLSRLAVFRGGFTRQAAESVAGATLPVLSALISGSLVRRIGARRYDMHELIRQYGWSQLQADDGEYRQAQESYCQYYANLLFERGPALKGADRPVVVEELISDLANLRQAWEWAYMNQRSREVSLSADTLFWLYESRSNCREGVPLFGRAVESLQSLSMEARTVEEYTLQLALGQALSYQGYFLFRQGQHPQGQSLLKSSLAILEGIFEYDTLEARLALSNTLAFLGAVTSVMGDFAGGEGMLQQAFSMKQDINDTWGSAFCLRQIGLLYHYRGEYAGAAKFLEQSLTLSRAMENTWAIAASLNQLGFVSLSLEDYARARQYLTDGLELSRTLEDRAGVAVALNGLSSVSIALGRFEEAANLLQESIALWSEIGERGSLAQTLVQLGEIFLKMGSRAEARKQFAEALVTACNAQITPVLLDALMGEAEIRLMEGEIESALGIFTLVSENPSSPNRTKERAQQRRTISEAQVPEDRSREITCEIRGKDLYSMAQEIFEVVQLSG